MSADARFPLDIEREMFETTAILHPKTIPTLLRICHRVHAWIEPLLYTVIAFSEEDDPIIPAIQSKSPSFLRNAVRHVFIGDKVFHAGWKFIFPHCSRLVSLFLDMIALDADDVPQRLQFLDNMALQRLNIQVPQSGQGRWAQLVLRPMALGFLSHLELFTLNASHSGWEDWSPLATLPALTHLCVSNTLSNAILVGAVAHCPHLIVIIAWYYEGGDELARAFAARLNVSDRRVVVMGVTGFDYIEDWQCGARGGEDFWVRAERFVARKRAKEIPINQYLLV
ncbi:hypothetical protein C8R46DRAFT_1095719 [Mycena filopes]|nr:hypothetical protein C8R46DRAFT_1095719 [Mycena filopes]